MSARAPMGSGSRERSAAAAAARSAVPAFTGTVLPDRRDSRRSVEGARYEHAGDGPDREALGGARADVVRRDLRVMRRRGEAEQPVAELGGMVTQRSRR